MAGHSTAPADGEGGANGQGGASSGGGSGATEPTDATPTTTGSLVAVEEGERCSDGVLVFCDNRCVDLDANSDHCGGCGNECSGGASCEGGSCVCVGSTDCSGTCIDTDSDPDNCGSCGTACDSDQVCSNGTCSSSCEDGAVSCDRSCVDTQSDVGHCGDCNSPCPTGASCVESDCVCPDGETVCDDECVNTTSNTSHCGQCGKVCGGDQVCVSGVCESSAQNSGSGGSTSTDGAGTGGQGTGGTTTTTDSGGTANSGGTGGGGTGGTGGSSPIEGPCDIYAAAGTPCVAAYSTVRRLSSAYTGPLYQVRSGSSAMNTGSGGVVHDVGATAAGFADAAAQDAACAGTTCTISLLYDQSGNNNHLPVAKAGLPDGGQNGGLDDFESIADAGPLTVGGHDVYSLYMAARQGYRLAKVGTGMPLGTESQGIYMLADGTHSGTACCWDFGNVSTDPKVYHVMNTLFFGIGYWGEGAGTGPWFMADFEAGVWAGGSAPGDPGWGGLGDVTTANPDNPSLKVRFALGFLKTKASQWSLRMADTASASSVTTAYTGAMPKTMDNQGGIVLGVGSDNSNNSWGTFYEGAILSGYPSDAAELAVMQNIQSAGYGE